MNEPPLHYMHPYYNSMLTSKSPLILQQNMAYTAIITCKQKSFGFLYPKLLWNILLLFILSNLF
ncbi:hypothetical protein BCE_1451 [Bacillus cereus ATCC 10987]|uniref:Uncharacterized protein n=1 Tax=Bacillus cereus (strain ATCC 10987 / NRS 248) TaxID=222523 RepID=Q73BG7_BACC1|nr:hypothetical protein BCE_1451 [Bacillus cereus ATCC 10987]